MTKHKPRLIALLLIETVLIVLHAILRAPADANASPTFEWHFWLVLIVGVVLIGYALSLRCPMPICRKHQVFRGLSFFDIRWPAERCHACSALLEQKPNAHKS